MEGLTASELSQPFLPGEPHRRSPPTILHVPPPEYTLRPILRMLLRSMLIGLGTSVLIGWALTRWSGIDPLTLLPALLWGGAPYAAVVLPPAAILIYLFCWRGHNTECRRRRERMMATNSQAVALAENAGLVQVWQQLPGSDYSRIARRLFPLVPSAPGLTIVCLGEIDVPDEPDVSMEPIVLRPLMNPLARICASLIVFALFPIMHVSFSVGMVLMLLWMGLFLLWRNFL